VIPQKKFKVLRNKPIYGIRHKKSVQRYAVSKEDEKQEVGRTPRGALRCWLCGFLGKALKMRRQQLISKLIDLDEQAKAHCSEYLRLIQMPGNAAKAALHNRKELRLRARIKDLMKQIAGKVF
jgi:hypothetical protein